MGSILLLCTLLLSINSYVFADDYSDCVENITQQAKNTCEAFEDESLTECNKKTTQSEILACQKGLQDQIEICISNLRTQNSGTCDSLKPKQTDSQKPHKTKEECLTNLKNDESNFAKCTSLEEKAVACYENSKDNVETICNDRFKSYFTTCNNKETSALKSDCEKELFGYIDKCISDYESDPQNTAGCKAQEDVAKKCREDGNKAIDQICEELYPDTSKTTKITTTTGTTTTTDTTSGTKIPTIPDIDTLVKPEVKDVSQVSPYLSSTFLPRVANTIVSFGIGAAVLGIILGSIGLLTAYGNDEKYGNAKKGIYFSLIGLIICLLAFAIVQLIFYTGYQAGQIR